MALFKKKGGDKETKAASLAIPLASPDGIAWITFPGEVVRSFRHMLSRQTRQEPLPSRTGLVSTLREEGVTYSSLALGTVLASDRAATVCVVELNWWWPGMMTHLPRVESGGLTAVLTEDTPLDEVIIKTGLPNLDLLPAGELAQEKRPSTARSDKLKQTLEELDQRYDYLLLDIPALLATSDAIPLASLSGGSCLVIKQGVTSIENVRLALDDIAHLDILGVILNQAIVKTPNLFLRFIPQE